MKNKISILALTVILFCILGCSPADNAEEAPPKSKTLSADKTEDTSRETALHSSVLVKAFNESKLSAAEKYEGKTLTVEGTVSDINDVFGTKQLNLRDSENEEGFAVYLADEGEIKKVQVGDKVIVRGICEVDGAILLSKSSVIEAKR